MRLMIGGQQHRASFSFADFGSAIDASLFSASRLQADEPYARSKDYDLQHSKVC